MAVAKIYLESAIRSVFLAEFNLNLTYINYLTSQILIAHIV